RTGSGQPDSLGRRPTEELSSLAAPVTSFPCPGERAMGRCLQLVLACVFISGPAFAADEGIPVKKLDELKAATVYVKVEAKEASATGSGFLILVEGETGYAVTNHHVAGVS